MTKPKRIKPKPKVAPEKAKLPRHLKRRSRGAKFSDRRQTEKRA